MKSFSSCFRSVGCALEYGPFERCTLNWCQARVTVTCCALAKAGAEIRGLGRRTIPLEPDVRKRECATWSGLHQLRRFVRENRTRSSKYEEQFLFKRWIAAVRAAIPSYLGIWRTPEFVSASGGSCCAGAREP